MTFRVDPAQILACTCVFTPLIRLPQTPIPQLLQVICPQMRVRFRYSERLNQARRGISSAVHGME